MRLLKCIICIAIVYLLSPLNGLTERETLDGAAKLVIAAQSLAPEAGKALALAGSPASGSGDAAKTSMVTGGGIFPAAAAGVVSGLASWFMPGPAPAVAPHGTTEHPAAHKPPAARTGQTEPASRPKSRPDAIAAQAKLPSPSQPSQPKPRPRDPAPVAGAEGARPR